MPMLVNHVRRGFYRDSVALMRISRTIGALAGVEAAALMIGSANNRKLMQDAGLLATEGQAAGANDLVLAVRADTASNAEAALAEAVRLLESGVASKEDIDQAMKLGCGYPMGPFTLLDLVGLDTTLYVAEVMFQEFREARFAPPPLLRRMVMAGRLGRKSGKGFYDHSAR